MESYNNYLRRYGTFTHILTFFISNELCESDKKDVISSIYNMLNEKEITKFIFNNNADVSISMKWRVADETNLLQYYTDGNVLLSDMGIQAHTKMVLRDIVQHIGNGKFTYIITKPITKQILLL